MRLCVDADGFADWFDGDEDFAVVREGDDVGAVDSGDQLLIHGEKEKGPDFQTPVQAMSYSSEPSEYPTECLAHIGNAKVIYNFRRVVIISINYC